MTGGLEVLTHSVVVTESEAGRMIERLWTRSYQFACTEAPEPGNLRVWVTEIGWSALVEEGLVGDVIFVEQDR